MAVETSGTGAETKMMSCLGVRFEKETEKKPMKWEGSRRVENKRNAMAIQI